MSAELLKLLLFGALRFEGLLGDSEGSLELLAERNLAPGGQARFLFSQTGNKKSALPGWAALLQAPQHCRAEVPPQVHIYTRVGSTTGRCPAKDCQQLQP